VRVHSRFILLGAGTGLVVVALGLLRPAQGGALSTPPPPTGNATPTAEGATPPAPDGAVDAGQADTLLVLSRIEGLLRLGRAEAAARLAAGVRPTDQLAPAIRTLQAWGLFAAGLYPELVALLPDEEILDDELLFLKGAALWRGARRDAGLAVLRELWWGEPEGVWGQAALRELAAPGPHSPYSRTESSQVLRAVPAVTFDTGRHSEVAPRATLEALRRAPTNGRLTAEVQHAMGASLLREEKFSEAVSALSSALGRTKDRALKRVIELRLGEAERRRGAYAAAQRHFAKVATGPTDRFTSRALAASGQMAIEFRRYGEARTLFETQLVKNPMGDTRHEALWGLGWVSFRTGDLRAARRFFLALFAEAPYGALAPRTLYWGARAIEDLGDRSQAALEMALVEGRFPIDYYAYRARAWRGEAPTPALVASALFGADQRITQIKAMSDTGMLPRAKKAIRELRRDWTALGPKDLITLEEVAAAAEDQRLAQSLQQTRHRRFPDESEAVELLRGQFPARFVTLLSTEAIAQRIDADLPAAVALQESRFNPRAVSPVGAVGLMQLMPTTARDMIREESRTRTRDPDLLNPAVNARLGVRYLGRMLRAFDRRAEYALAAYNAGPGAVTRWREAKGDLPVDIFVEEIPYTETRDYVRRVLAGLQTYRFVSTWETRLAAPVSELARVSDAE
jgi:soluble lytic murein transglycosylase